MPLCTVKTNLPKSKIPGAFLQECTNVVAATLGKSPERVTIMVEADCHVSKGGSTDPFLYMSIISMEGLSKEKNPSYSHHILKYLEQAFPDIEPGRAILIFNPLDWWNIAINRQQQDKNRKRSQTPLTSKTLDPPHCKKWVKSK